MSEQLVNTLAHRRVPRIRHFAITVVIGVNTVGKVTIKLERAIHINHAYISPCVGVKSHSCWNDVVYIIIEQPAIV